MRLRAFGVTEATLLLASDRKSDAARVATDTARQSLKALDGDSPADMPDELDIALSAALVALRAGDGRAAMEVLATADAHPHLHSLPYIAEMQAVVRAWQAIAASRSSEAIALVEPYVDGSARYQTHEVLRRAFLLAGDSVAAEKHARWLQQHRGQAYIELGCGQCRQTLNVIDSNRPQVAAASLSGTKRQ